MHARIRILAASALAVAGLMTTLTGAAVAGPGDGPVAEAPPTEAGIVECTDGVATLRPLTPDELAVMDKATIGRPVDPSDPDAVYTVVMDSGVMDHGQVAVDVEESAVPAEAVAALPVPATDMAEMNPNHPCADPKE